MAAEIIYDEFTGKTKIRCDIFSLNDVMYMLSKER